jgi:ATP-dependent Zn protease
MSVISKAKDEAELPLNATVSSNASMDGDATIAAQESGSGAGGLARRFLDILVEDATGGVIQKLAAKSKDGDAIDGLLDDLDDDGDDHASVRLSVDLAVAAVRLARTIEAEPGLVQALREKTPVVVIETGDAATHPEVEQVLKICALGRATNIYGPKFFERTLAPKHSERGAAIFERSAAPSLSDVRAWDRCFANALQARVLILGIAADPHAQLPADLVRAADYRLSLDPLDQEGIALVIGAITGQAPSARLDDAIVCDVDISDLRIAVHADRGADGSLARLADVVKKRLVVSDSTARLDDLFGYGEAKAIGLAIVADLAAYREGKIPWAAVDKGLLLAGPPGTGKTTFAKALAKSAGLPLVAGSLAQWQSAREGHLGHCLAAMRASFAEAKRKAPCFLFVDELDSFGDRATFDHHNKDYSTQVVNGFLECLDGVGGRQGVVVIGATNHDASIDPAITRAGRLDRTVRIPLPDVTALAQILRFHLKDDLLGADLSAAAVAARGGSGADCEAWVRRARGEARRAGHALTLDGLVAAIRDGRMSLPDDIRKRISIHEAGHAVAALALGLGEPRLLTVHDGGGLTQVKFELRAMTARDVIAAIAQLLAGREAELLQFGDVTAGAGGDETSDLARATTLAAAFEGAFGLGSFGPVWLGAPDDLVGPFRLTTFGSQIREILYHAGTEARRALNENRAALESLANALYETSYLDAVQIRDALGPIRKIDIRPLAQRADKRRGIREFPSERSEGVDASSECRRIPGD